ncbi:MAG: hypothetical protein WBA74_03250, partial [Cyclobacteriaceae bacterium]
MKKIDITRPDKILLSGIKSISDFTQSLYSEEKTIAKGRGEVTFIGEKKVEEVITQLYQYNKDEVSTEDQPDDLSFFEQQEAAKVSWLNVYGLHDVPLVQGLAQY